MKKKFIYTLERKPIEYLDGDGNLIGATRETFGITRNDFDIEDLMIMLLNIGLDIEDKTNLTRVEVFKELVRITTGDTK